MGSMLGKNPGERYYFKVAMQLCRMLLVGEPENSGSKASHTGQDARCFDIPFFCNTLQFNKDILTWQQPKWNVCH